MRGPVGAHCPQEALLLLAAKESDEGTVLYYLQEVVVANCSCEASALHPEARLPPIPVSTPRA
jgi:hypothetical protein